MVLISSLGFSQSLSDKVLVDSIQKLVNYSSDTNLNEAKRFGYAEKANVLAKSLGNDSINLLTNSNVKDFYVRQGDLEAYKIANRKLIVLSEKLEDSLTLGHAHYGLAYSLSTQYQDSAYSHFSKAVKIFDKLNERTLLSYGLGSLASLQLDGKDYFGAEENAVRALKVLDGVDETNDILDQKWILYNLLGNVANSLKNYDKSLEYHYEAIDVAKAMDDDFNNEIYSLNNIAYVKGEQGLYDEAVKIYKDISQRKNLSIEDPSFYALILENLAYSTYLTGTYDKNTVEHLFERSYTISDSIDDPITKTYATISMAKYYKGIGESAKAKSFAIDAYNLAKRLNSNEIYLESMKLLSELNEGEKGKMYLNEYIRVSDSLLNVERNVRNKSARIELETDKLAAENKQISKENLYLVILSIGLLLTAILTYLFIAQRAKNRKLKLIQVQQKANEDIYNLMLGQQDKVDEARAKEKTRVSKELHDGVLGGLFGVRLSLDSINFQEGKEAMMTRAKYISQLQTIEQDIRKISHELNTDFVSGSGFIDIIRELIETQCDAYGLEHKFNYTDDINWDLISNKTKINCFRIIQESMQNIYKHANAKHIEISISLENNLICLAIIDDGSGFDTSKSRKGIGLKNMHSRVDDIQGSILFTSKPGTGTTVNVKIPYTN
ncbi:tetratricopeptide repeat protein [Winogradskyella sp. F6397]|uniref:histidine kinase n=1 Tax=Winogradskyella marina TaxID=2785530 RepID=A0ABS0EEB5_9FLAO|nr:tetratricopeptide repeat-containing sensor histidine kinase [Winogradskyella marina]MBF8148783.1 tetratricopeptide repeat protein [Winogradskyella marina]